MELSLSDRLVAIWDLMLVELQDLSFFGAVFGISFVVILCTMLYMIWNMNERQMELQNTVITATLEERVRRVLLSVYRAYSKGLFMVQKTDVRHFLTLEDAKAHLRRLQTADAEIAAAYTQALLALGETIDENKLKKHLLVNRERYDEIVMTFEEYVNNGSLASALDEAWGSVNRDFSIAVGNVYELTQNRQALEYFYRAFDNESIQKLDALMIDYQTKLINEDFEHFFDNCLSSKFNQV